jgi:hypothetical protein
LLEAILNEEEDKEAVSGGCDRGKLGAQREMVCALTGCGRDSMMSLKSGGYSLEIVTRVVWIDDGVM